MIEEKDWEWYGFPSHFIGANECSFHMVTKVGKWVISSVGCYRTDPEEEEREIGFNRKYETMVFKFDKDSSCTDPKCGCGQPSYTNEELLLGSNTAKEAREIHMKTCYQMANEK